MNGGSLRTRAFFLVWACTLGTACLGGGLRPAFDLSRQDNRPRELAAVDAAAGASDPGAAVPGPGATSPYALVYTDGPAPRLARYPVSFGAAAGAEGPQANWERTLRLDAKPVTLPDAVVSAAGGRLLVLDPSSGRDRFQAPLAEPVLIGAAQVGSTLVTVSFRDEPPVRSVVTGYALDTGRVRFTHRVDGRVGRPASVGALALLPWNAQFMLALDGATGREVARLRSRRGRITWVRSLPDGTYFGDERLYRGLTAYLDGDGSREGGRAGRTLPGAGLPGAPLPYPSDFEPIPAARSAYGRVGLHFRLAADDAGDPGPAGDHLALVFFRHVYGLDGAGAPRWARVLEADVVTAKATADGLLVLTDAGELLQLSSADGRILGRTRLPASAIASAILTGAVTPTGGGPRGRQHGRCGGGPLAVAAAAPGPGARHRQSAGAFTGVRPAPPGFARRARRHP